MVASLLRLFGPGLQPLAFFGHLLHRLAIRILGAEVRVKSLVGSEPATSSCGHHGFLLQREHVGFYILSTEGRLKANRSIEEKDYCLTVVDLSTVPFVSACVTPVWCHHSYGSSLDPTFVRGRTTSSAVASQISLQLPGRLLGTPKPDIFQSLAQTVTFSTIYSFFSLRCRLGTFSLSGFSIGCPLSPFLLSPPPWPPP